MCGAWEHWPVHLIALLPRRLGSVLEGLTSLLATGRWPFPQQLCFSISALMWSEFPGAAGSSCLQPEEHLFSGTGGFLGGQSVLGVTSGPQAPVWGKGSFANSAYSMPQRGRAGLLRHLSTLTLPVFLEVQGTETQGVSTPVEGALEEFFRASV